MYTMYMYMHILSALKHAFKGLSYQWSIMCVNTSRSHQRFSAFFCCYIDVLNPNPLGCVQNRIQIGGFGTVRGNYCSTGVCI